METYIEKYQAKHGGVTLHAWREREGRKEENYYITGVAGAPVAAWFRRSCVRTTSAIWPTSVSPSDCYA